MEKGGVDLELISDRAGRSEAGCHLPVGSRVVYAGHLSGGAVRVVLPDGAVEVVSPRCFAELR